MLIYCQQATTSSLNELQSTGESVNDSYGLLPMMFFGPCTFYKSMVHNGVKCPCKVVILSFKGLYGDVTRIVREKSTGMT